MKLTGKARGSFEEWLKENYGNVPISGMFFLDEVFITLPEVIQNALIVEFLDEQKMFVGMELDGTPYSPKYATTLTFDRDYLISGVDYFFFKESRQEAITAAIEKANEILNQKLNGN